MKHIKIGTDYYREEKRDGRSKVIGLSLLLTIAFGSMFYACSKGINEYFENQDRMLCESAKVSRNRKYLEKCECYYQGDDIKCLHR